MDQLAIVGIAATVVLTLAALRAVRPDRLSPLMVTVAIQLLFVVATVLVAFGVRSSAPIRVPPVDATVIRQTLVGACLLVFGMLLGTGIPVPRSRRYTVGEPLVFRVLTFAVLAMVGGYFLLAGSPLFSDEIIRARWRTGGGGLVSALEVINLYALPMTYIVLSVARKVSPERSDPQLHLYQRLALAALLLSRLLSGFRGQFLNAVLLVLIVDLAIGEARLLRSVGEKWRLILAGLLLVVVVNGIYVHQGEGPEGSPLELLAGRVLVRPGEDVAGIADYGPGRVDIPSDIDVVLGRITSGDPGGLTFNESFGAWQRRVADPVAERRQGRILATTTPGGVQYFMAAGGATGIGAIVALGLGLGYCTRLARSGSVERRFLALTLALMCHEIVQRGNPVPQIIGWIVGLGVFSAGYFACKVLVPAVCMPLRPSRAVSAG